MGTKLEAKASIKLTNESVRALPLVTSGKTYVYDTERRGFCVRVTPTGKFYAVRVKVHGKEFQRSICRVEDTTAIAARNKAEVIIGELRQGVDRNQQRRDDAKAAREEAKRVSLESATLTTWLADYLGRKTLKPRTVSDYNGLLGVELLDWANKPLREIDRNAAELKYKEISHDRGVYRAVHSLRLVRILCRDSKQGLQDWSKFFPKLPPKKTKLRHSDGQVIYSELKGMKNTLASSKYVLGLLLTGCRRGELADVLVSDVGVGCRTITIRDPKNGKDHIIQCSTQLREIVETLVIDKDGDRRPADATLFGLCGDPRKTLKRINGAVQESADMASEVNGTAVVNKHFSLHHLRKLCGITLNHLRFPHATIQAILNHTPDASDVTSRSYIDVDEEEMRVAWQALADYYSVGKSNVIKLPTAMAA